MTSSSRSPPPAESSFFRALNAPFVPTPFLDDEPRVPVPLIADPVVPPGNEPLMTPIFTSTGDWEWLNGKTLYDIHELATLHEDQNHKVTIRACRAGDRSITYLNKAWRLDKRHPGIMSELWLYKHPLKNLKGIHIPTLIAVRISANTFNLLFELPHQTLLMEPSRDMPDVLKRRVIKALEKIHAKGVSHGWVNLDNILIGADGKVYFYNFHNARYVTANPDVYLREVTETDFQWEVRKLKFKLDFEGARAKEKEILAQQQCRYRNNDMERRKVEADSEYKPKYLKRRLGTIDSPIRLAEATEWFYEDGREPRRFIMPGQTVDDFEWELKRLYNTLRKMEEVDLAAGITKSHAQPELTNEDAEDSVGSATTDVEYEPSSSSLKRKRSPGRGESRSSSSSSFTKRARRRNPKSRPIEEFPPSISPFKHEELRPALDFIPATDIKLMSDNEMPAVIQENNLLPFWPLIVVRDFAKESRVLKEEEDVERYVRIRKRLRVLRAEKDEGEVRCGKRRKLDECGSWATWAQAWNPLRSVVGDKGTRREVVDPNPAQRRPKVPPLSTVLNHPAIRAASRAPVASAQRKGPHHLGNLNFDFEMRLAPNHAFPPVPSAVAPSLQTIGRVLEALLLPTLTS